MSARVNKPGFFLLLLFMLIAAGVMSAIHTAKVGKYMRETTGIKQDEHSETGETDFSGGIFMQQFLEFTE